MVIITSRNFDKEMAELPLKIKESLRERLELFKANPFAELLNNHQLHGSLRHYRSINISGNYRLFYENLDDDVIRLMRIGTHSELYGK